MGIRLSFGHPCIENLERDFLAISGGGLSRSGVIYGRL